VCVLEVADGIVVTEVKNIWLRSKNGMTVVVVQDMFLASHHGWFWFYCTVVLYDWIRLGYFVW
jgi:hypothetical protein